MKDIPDGVKIYRIGLSRESKVLIEEEEVKEKDLL
jgi:hypothetical protein